TAYCQLDTMIDSSDQMVRLMPLQRLQKLYAGSDFGELFLELSATTPLYLHSIFMDDQPIPIYGASPLENDIVLSAHHRWHPVYAEMISGWSSQNSYLMTYQGDITPQSSIYFYSFNVKESGHYIMSVIQAEFDPEMILFTEDSILDMSDLLLSDDDSGSGNLPKISTSLIPGNYMLAVSGFPFPPEHAVQKANPTDNTGNFSLSVARTVETGIVRIRYADGVPENTSGSLRVTVMDKYKNMLPAIEIQVPVETDPEPDIQLAAPFDSYSGTITKYVGEAIDIPVQLKDSGYNALWVQYSLDGQPVAQKWLPPGLSLFTGQKIHAKIRMIEPYQDFVNRNFPNSNIMADNLTRVERNLIYLTMDQAGYYHITVDHSLPKLAVILPLTDDYQVFWPASWDTSSYILFEPNT
ncbi:hypothetical protein MHK_004715, partial [Candidatus Magnetomorum sp. HK-1]